MCKYFPCHDKTKLETCLFCYCPVYPCFIRETGGKTIDSQTGAKIWDCSDCTIIHNREFVEKIKSYIMNELNTELYMKDNITAKKLRKEFDDKLKELQDNCKHEVIEILPYMWAPGHYSGKVKVCKSCEKIIGKEDSTTLEDIVLFNFYDNFSGEIK